jgi:hypothetical protein
MQEGVHGRTAVRVRTSRQPDHPVALTVRVHAVDLANHVVALCGRGMEAEGAGDADRAATLFAQAWAEHTDDFEAAVAAHYVARHQSSPEATRGWNALAVERAEAARSDARVLALLPSLYRCLGRSHEELGDHVAARDCYERAGGAPAAVQRAG